MATEYVKIGSILKPTGISGEVKVDPDESFEKDFYKAKHFFLLINGDYVPYFVEYVKDINHFVIKFEDIDTPEQGVILSLKDVYMRESDISSKTYKNQKQKSEWIGYTIVNQDEVIGAIDEIIMFPQQIMAQVTHNGIEKLIPLVDEWIESLDQRKKTVKMLLPDGLLDI